MTVPYSPELARLLAGKLKSFPVSLVTTCRQLLIVGGGHEAEPKLAHAIKFGWHAITLVAPHITDGMRRLAEEDLRVALHERLATEDDVLQADYVIEDSGSRAVAEELVGWCRKHRRAINAMDKPELCDIFYTSLVFREPLVISISSGGNAPALSSVLRRTLEEKIGPGWSLAARLLAETRDRLPGGQARMDLLKRIARDPMFIGFVEANDEQGMRNFIEDAVLRL